ncbi:MAG: nicotinate (nicotinamide) nucleotide adenylyltransferase [Clostridia bacterium]|nr:nicotinate (nicotinamide) nucleotide adenylyltransferase [Clostridia bacterium]
MKIGIFGGSFNPPHTMHKNIAQELINKSFVDKVIFVPTGNRYHKDSLLDATHRINMLKLLCQENKNFDVSDYEAKNTLVSTYQTLDYFQSCYPDDTIYFILGSDNLKELHMWKNYEYIISHYKILIIKRDLDNIPSILEKFKDYSSNFIVADIPLSNISSTKIRSILSKSNIVSTMYISTSILDYIRKNNLYI